MVQEIPPAAGPADRVSGSVLDAIGFTPLVALDRLTRADGLEGRVLLKLDTYSPGHSKKDRIALGMIRAARQDGRLAPGQGVVERTSGNTGTGLAVVCSVLGHPFTAVMSAGNSSERARMMAALGARVVIVPQAPGGTPGRVTGEDLALVEAEADRIAAEQGALRLDQWTAPGNVEAHLTGTGPEILRQTGGDVDVFCDFVGSGGTFTGVARALKAALPEVRCYVIEPAGAPHLAGEEVVDPGHAIQGGGYARDVDLFDPSVCDGYRTVTDDAARTTARRLAAEEGVFAGFSTGANVAAALDLLRTDHPGATVACVACDSGLKYLSTDLWPDVS